MSSDCRTGGEAKKEGVGGPDTKGKASTPFKAGCLTTCCANNSLPLPWLERRMLCILEISESLMKPTDVFL